MSEENKPFPCPLCQIQHETAEAAEQCFMEHTKEEHLIWAFRELYKLCEVGYSLFDKMDRIVSKYELDNELDL